MLNIKELINSQQTLILMCPTNKTMIIREATIKDSELIATYLLLAMEDIVYKFIGKKDKKATINLLQHFVKAEQNQYSFQNCLVAEYSGKIIAAINFYDGANFIQLREPFLQYIKTNFNKDFNPEIETQAGEYYIDTLGVDQSWQGKGIGSKLLKFLIEKYVVQAGKTLGLLVEEENPNAKRLYLKLGFKSVGKQILVGKQMEHLQIRI